MVTDADLVLAKKVAYRIGSKWTAVEIEDLTSELILWLYANAEKVAEYRREDGDGKLFVSLRRHASRYAVKEQTIRAGGVLDTESPYTVEQIERALPFLWELAPETLDVNGLAVSIFIDLRLALEALPPEGQEALLLRFRDGLNYEEIGLLTGLSDRGARKRVVRAIERMRSFLAGEPSSGR